MRTLKVIFDILRNLPTIVDSVLDMYRLLKPKFDELHNVNKND